MTQLATTPSTKPALPMSNKGVQLENFEALWRFATCIAASPFAPKGMEKAEAIVPAIQLGLELGMTPMAALQNVAVINGRPGIYGDAALALARASGLMESYTQEVSGEGDARKAVVMSKRKDSQAITSSFSVGDAKKAGLWGKQGPWTQYPDRMLLFRARGFNLRDNFGDVLKGLRTVEEIQDISPEKMATAMPVVNIKPVEIQTKAELEAEIEAFVEKKNAEVQTAKAKSRAKKEPELESVTLQPGEEHPPAANAPSDRDRFAIMLDEAGYNEAQALKALRAMTLIGNEIVSLKDVEYSTILEVLKSWDVVFIPTLAKLFPA